MASGKPNRQAVFGRLDVAVTERHDRFGGLPSSGQASDNWAELWHRDTHHSAAIEGNTLALVEIERLLEADQTSGRKSLSDHVEVKGYADAANGVYSQAFAPSGLYISMHEVRQVHHLAL